MQTYRRLDHARITQTLEALRDRIAERFPDANLRRLSEQLLQVSRESADCVSYLERPTWPLRIGATAVALGLIAVFVAVAGLTLTAPAQMGISDLVQTIEAGVNDIVFLGIAVFFVMSIESRLKRRRALRMLHELRSLAHIVDMHQLTKDPERLASKRASPLPDQPQPTLGIDLGKYLDFCSELLSVISKIAALFAQHFNDSVVLTAVNEIETLTTGLSGKIWQKITILERSMGAVPAPPLSP
jgi:hypothetical protein